MSGHAPRGCITLVVEISVALEFAKAFAGEVLNSGIHAMEGVSS